MSAATDEHSSQIRHARRTEQRNGAEFILLKTTE
jgi:hypothetical protein